VRPRIDRPAESIEEAEREKFLGLPTDRGNHPADRPVGQGHRQGVSATPPLEGWTKVRHPAIPRALGDEEAGHIHARRTPGTSMPDQ
jgi:hypothetical protein